MEASLNVNKRKRSLSRTFEEDHHFLEKGVFNHFLLGFIRDKIGVEVCKTMLVTSETVQLLDGAEHIGKMILQSDVVEHYRQCLYTFRQDQEAQALVAEFVKMKERYEEVQRFGRYHPDYKTVTKQTRELKRSVDLHETVIEFKKAENAVQKLLDEVSVILGYSISEQIKVPTGNPFFDTGSSCGGGCGSGGSCGCSVH